MSFDFVLDLNVGYKKVFYESYDTELWKWKLQFARKIKGTPEFYVLNSDLSTYNMIDGYGNLSVSLDQILASTGINHINTNDQGVFDCKLASNNKYLECFFNVWLPMPYIEEDGMGNYSNGPYNWCRCKLIPLSEQNGKKNMRAILVFDTRAVYPQNNFDLYKETPIFESKGDISKQYSLCDEDSHLVDFCNWNDGWVLTYLLHLAYPDVADIDTLALRLGPNAIKYGFLATYLTLIGYIKSCNSDETFVTLWRDHDVPQVPIEMIVDIGNSRTSAIMFEDQNFTKVDTLRLQDFTNLLTKDNELNRKDDTFDMRLAFRKVDFGPVIQNSHQFVWPSMVSLGREAQQLTHTATALALGQERLSTYSSPKRYLWDDKSSEHEWCFTSTEPSQQAELTFISGVSNFISDNGSVDRDGYGVGSHYSRHTLMTLAFIEIVQQALVQINSPEFRKHNGKVNTPRSLKKIILTCPTAMSLVEQEALYQSLHDAVFILSQYNKVCDFNAPDFTIDVIPDTSVDEDGNRKWFYDEATCSQLVFVYGQFCERYLNCSDRFFQHYGKLRDVGGQQRYTINIGSVDIGAGTTDVTVCQYMYNDKNPSQLCPVPKYWDSFNEAGDDMLHTLITNIIIDGGDAILYRHLQQLGWDRKTIIAKLYRFFGYDNNMMSFAERLVRRDFNLQVNVPVMYCFLDLLSKGVNYRDLSYEEVLGDNLPSQTVLEAFKNHFGFDLKDIRWVYDAEVISRYVERSMTNLIETISSVLYAYDCDVILLSGRPTMLPPIKKCFLRYMAVAPNRMIVMGRYHIGRWYPFKDEQGFMINTKSVVPVGAMIGYMASTAGGLNGFSLNLSTLGSGLKPTTECFLKRNVARRDEMVFISKTKHSGQVMANSFPLYIATKQYDLGLYPWRPFYVININKEEIEKRIKDAHQDISPQQLQQHVDMYCTELLRRAPFTFSIERPDYPAKKEYLVIENVTDANGDDLDKSDFSLSIQSLNSPDCYWLDSGEFSINIANDELSIKDNGNGDKRQN